MSRRAAVLAAGDLAALLVFALVGLASHDGAVGMRGLARDWIPLAVGYAAAALLARAWTQPSVVALLRAWLTGVTAGVVLRGLALGRDADTRQLQFLLVSLVVTLVLLSVWRALEHVLRRR